MSKLEMLEVVVPIHKSMNEILCLQRIEQAEHQIGEYEQLYGLDYETFNHQIGTDETFLQITNQNHPTWEADAIEWEYRLEELQTWQTRLEKILSESRPSLASS